MVTTEKDFENWLEHPVTRQMRRRIKKDIELLNELMTNVSNLHELGELQGRKKAAINFLEVEYSTLVESDKDKGREYDQ